MLYSQSEDNILQFCMKMSFHPYSEVSFHWVENTRLAIFSSHIDIINPLFSDFHFHCWAVSYQCNSHSYFKGNLSFVLFQLLLIKCCLCCWCSLHATMMCLDVYFLLAILLVIICFLKCMDWCFSSVLKHFRLSPLQTLSPFLLFLPSTIRKSMKYCQAFLFHGLCILIFLFALFLVFLSYILDNFFSPMSGSWIPFS